MDIVTINAGTLKVAMISPLRNPASVPRSSPTAIARTMGIPWLTIRPAVRVPHMATQVPTERSIPPRIMTSVIPRARYILFDTCRSTDRRLSVVRKTGEAKLRITEIITSTAIIPELPFSIFIKLLFFIFYTPVANLSARPESVS